MKCNTPMWARLANPTTLGMNKRTSFQTTRGSGPSRGLTLPSGCWHPELPTGSRGLPFGTWGVVGSVGGAVYGSHLSDSFSFVWPHRKLLAIRGSGSPPEVPTDPLSTYSSNTSLCIGLLSKHFWVTTDLSKFLLITSSLRFYIHSRPPYSRPLSSSRLPCGACYYQQGILMKLLQAF